MTPLYERKLDSLRTILGRIVPGAGDFPMVAVETGTLHGEFTVLLPDLFPVVHTIEKSEELYERLPKRDKRINWHCGDSRVVLEWLLPTLDQPCLFFLDAHWFSSQREGRSDGVVGAADFPLWGELDLIRERRHGDLVVVDDTPCFGKDRGPEYAGWEGVTPESLVERLGRVCRSEAVDTMFAMWRTPV